MKLLTAEDVLLFITDIQRTGIDLRKVTINYRYDDDSDVVICSTIEEDLFDEETNSKISSIIFKSNYK